ncbi:hypothetical protein [Streptomyces luteogriseus]|uniref:hypothetical protein n=1 Tax=Streptomyces luteogriseus TaxID=68233 RepID=UPI0037AA272D
MSIKPSPEVNAMIFILTGERLIDADEDLAYESRRPYSGLGRKLDRMSSLIDKSIHDIAEVMPDDLSKSYARAMGMLIDDGGKNYLREFAEQLDKIAEGRRKTSMDIMESKWQVIAEVIRLLIEIAIYLAMSFFTGGASASQIMMAKLRSRFMILTTLTHLLQRLHLAPSLTEAFAEAFTTLAVRLAMMNFAPQGRRPDGVDWGDVGKAAAFGAAAGGLTSIFDDFAKRLVKGYDNNFLKNGPDLDFKKNPGLRDIPDPEFKNKGPGSRPDPDPTPNPNGPDHRPDPTPYGNGPTPGTNTPITFRNNPLSFRNNPDLWRNNLLLRNNADRPGALAGHYGLKGTADFLAAGAGEALAEILIKGAFDGDWSTSWSTFAGAGLSSLVEAGLTGTAQNTGAELRHAIDKLRNQPPPTVSTGGDGTDRSRSSDTPGTDSAAHPDTTGGAGSPAPLPPPLAEQAPGSGDGLGSQSPPPYSAGNPPPYTSPAPPPYSPGTLPVTAAENQLWQQVHHGSAEVREQALRDLASLRGSQPPGSHEIGVRDGLRGDLSQRPEVRVVPAGNGPAAEIDTDAVRRALESFGTPVTVEPPLTAGRGGSAELDDAGVSAAPGAGPGVGVGPGVGAGVGTGAGAGAGAGVGSGVGSGMGAGSGAGSGAGAGTGAGSGSGAGSPSGAGSGVGSGATPGAGDRAGGVPSPGGNAPSSAAPQAQGSRAPGGTAGSDGTDTSSAGTGSPETTPSADATPLTEPAAPSQSVATSNSAENELSAGTAPTPDPPKVSTTGTYADTGGPAAAKAPPLTVVVSEGPPPGEGSQQASELLDGAGTDRAVVLGPAVASDGAGRPVRAAVELTREGPGAPVKVRPLNGPPSAVTPDGAGVVTEGTDLAAVPVTTSATDVDFPGADVLLPLADALGVTPDPAARPVTESTEGSLGVSGTTLTDTKTDSFAPVAAEPTVSKLTTLSRPWTEPATDLYLESGGNGTGGDVPGTGAGRGLGNGVNPPPPPTITPDVPAPDLPAPDSPAPVRPTQENPPAAPPVPTPPVVPTTPPGRIVVRPESPGGAADDAEGSARRGGEPYVTTLDGHTVPVAQLRRWVPDTAVKPQPGRAVQTLTISQGPAEDDTAHGAGRRALLGQDTFRGVRTTSTATAAESPAGTPGSPAGTPGSPAGTPVSPANAESPPLRRTVFTGPPAPLPGSGTERGADYFVAHATSRTVTLGTEDAARPTVEVSGVQLGEVLKSWARDDDQDRPLVLFSCETGRQPRVAGLPVAQHVANRTGRPVYAPTTEVGTARDGRGEVRAVLTEGPDGPGRWRLFTPEPGGAELDRLARVAGLHAGPEPADAFARARTLQQIRTLRDALGPDAEQRPENHELLAGLAYVDGLRWLSPATAARYGDGRMTPDLLRRMVLDRPGAVNGTGSDPAATGPTAEQYTAFLRAAAELRATAGPDTTLDALLPPPPPALPPGTLVSPDDVRGLSYAPGAQVTWSLAPTPLPLSELALSPEDTAELARRRPDLVPAASRPATLAEDVTLLSKDPAGAGPDDLVTADGVAFRRLDTPGGGNCLFRALLDSARSLDVPPAWAARNVAGLRTLLRDRLAGSELLTAAAEATPDPVLAVVDDLRMRALAGESDPESQRSVNEHWNRIARAVVTGGDAARWQQILRDSDYPHLARVAPTPADARRLGTGGLVTAAAEQPGLWSSPFGDLLPQALAHTLDLDLRLVQPDPQAQGSTFVVPLHPGGQGGQGGTLHLAYNGRDHFDALMPASAPITAVPDPAPTGDAGDAGGTAPPARREPDPSAETPSPDSPSAEGRSGRPPAAQDTSAQDTPAQDGSDPFGEWLRGMGGITDVHGPESEAPDKGDPVPLETQLDRYRPPRLLTGADVTPPGPAPRTVTFEDGSRLPSVLIDPDGDPNAPASGGRTDGSVGTRPSGLFTGPGVLTLRSPDQVARQILGELPQKLRDQFDEAELLRLLTTQPAAFTAPRGARLVGREKSGVGHEMTIEAVPYHRWERFSDVDGATVRVDTLRRGQAGTGGGRSVGFGRRIAAGISMGPPLSWLVKIGVSLGWTRRTDYSQGTQAYNQSEHRAWEGSHLHLDDVHYRVRVERVTEAPANDGRHASSGTPAARPGWRRQEILTRRFAVRDGLSWRLPDDLTVPYAGPRRAPRTLTFPDGREPRATDITALHFTDPPEDLALAISGARPGSSAHRTLVSYVRPGRLLALFGRLTGPVSGPELTRGSGQHPLGHLVVERSIPQRATLVTESVKAEIRDLTQTTYQNERGHVRDTRFGIQVTSGPNHTFIGPETDVRLQGGPLVRADFSSGRGHHLGTDAARKTTGRVRNHPVALYRVERTLMVRKAGDPPSAARPVRVVSLDWMSTQDARRLAGWDSRTPGQAGPDPDARPAVPWYLTREDPVHLSGQVRAEGFVPDHPQPLTPGQDQAITPEVTSNQDQAAELEVTPGQDQSVTPPEVTPGQDQAVTPPEVTPASQQDQEPLAAQEGQRSPAVQEGQARQSRTARPPAPQDPMRVFTDAVLDTLHRSYPSMFVPPLMLRHQRLARFWYGDGRMRTALHNDRQVREALNRPSLAQSLDDLTTTGVPVTLTEDGKVRRGHHTLILRARLTDRRFESTMSERSLRNAVIGTEVSGQGQQASSTLSGGAELGISPRDHDKVPEAGLPRQTGNVSLGARYSHTEQKATRSTVAVTHDHLTFQNGAHLYSYRVELSASFEGHRRPRGWARLLSVGLLGAGVFVSKAEERPLFSKGSETVGRVELAVPAAHASERHAPVDPAPGAPSTTPAAPAPAPGPRRVSAAEADQLLDGTRPLPRREPADQRLTQRLLSAPHVVLSVEGGPQRQQLVQDTADRAAGGTWHVSAPGAPVRTALRRAMANLSVAGQLGQYLGPFGSRIAGLNGAGPFRTHYLKAAVRGELHNLRVKSDPKPASLEATIGNEHRVVGTEGTLSHTTLGLQGADMPLQQAPGQQAVMGSYATALQYAWGKGRTLSQTLTRGRNTTLTFAGRMYLVVADATETVAVRDRWTAAMGMAGTRAAARVSSAAGHLSGRLARGLAPRRAAAALQHIRDAVMFHLPMQDVIEAGLAPDGLGTSTPDNLGRGYRVPGFLRGRRFPGHPSGRLDASHAAQRLMRQLERIGVPSHDREQVLQRLSPDFLRANLHELTTDGATLPVRYRTWHHPTHLPAGGSPAQLRFKLTPKTTTVERLRTGFELEDYRTTARDDADGSSQDRGADVTLSAGQRATESGVLIAAPSLQGTAAKKRATTRTETDGRTSMPNIATVQAHAEMVTEYILTVTMTDASGDPLRPRAVAPVGSLREIVPANLLTPDGDGADGALTEQDVPQPERAVRMLTADQARPDGIAAWRTSSTAPSGDTGSSDILPFDDDRIGSGILAVDIHGAANVRDALTLATARADGFGDSDLGGRHTGDVLAARVRMARHTPLTGLGTAPAQAQQEATTQAGLTAGFREALSADGSPLPTQASARLVGQFHTADSRLYAKMHRSGARLLAVENKPRMEAMQRAKTSDALESGITDNIEGAVGSAPLAGNSNAGVTNPGATVPIGGANDGTTLKGTTDTTLGTHIKVVTNRSMLFALPVSWLSVAEVDHRLTDSRPLHALGKAKRGPRAAEARTTALVWLREDIARDYGLLDDTTFPDEVAKAWDDLAKAAGDLATAEQRYYDARARARETWLDLTTEEQAALGADAPVRQAPPGDGNLKAAPGDADGTPGGEGAPGDREGDAAPGRQAAPGDGDAALKAAPGDGGSGRPAVLPPAPAESPAVTAWQAARDEIRRWQERTDAAAADHHRLHLAASRLTAHHQGLPSVPVPDRPQEYTEPGWRSEAPEPYTITDGTDSAPRTLTSPDGATVREVHDVPHDGASFFHALLATAGARGRLPQLLGTDLADRFTAAPGDPGVTAEAVGAARDRLAWALGEDGNEDLLDALALDVADTFTQDELDAAGVVFTPAQQAEFDAFGRLPLTFWPTPALRVALAAAALSRPFAPEPHQETDASPGSDPVASVVRRAGDHGGADLLPALAARILGTPLTVVTGEGGAQLFLPHGTDPAAVDPAGDPVLYAADGFFHAALPPGTPAPVTTALPTPATETSADSGSGTITGSGTGTGTSTTAPGATDSPPAPQRPPAHRSHATPPWMPPADSTGPRYRLDRTGVLTAPDGATYTQGAPTGRGNGFFGALSTALSHAADRPGLEGSDAARLRARARRSPSELMRQYGLPGDPAERDGLFTPPPLVPRRGMPEPSAQAREAHVRAHLARAPWGPEADRAVAEWAATATSTTVSLIEENGTAHTYPAPTGTDGPHLRLRRRGGDFVPLILRTPAPEPKQPETQLTPTAEHPPTARTGADTTAEAPTADTRPAGTTPHPAAPSSSSTASTTQDTAPPPPNQDRAPLPSHSEAAATPLPLSPAAPKTTGASPAPSDAEEEARELSTLTGADPAPAQPTAAPQPSPRPFKLGSYEFTNLNQTDAYLDKAVRIIELLDEHSTISDYVNGRPVRITLHLRTTETPADVRDLGPDGVQINLASYYFEKYDTGYIMGMLAHEIGLHPLASRNTDIPEQEEAYRGMPLPVPGLTDLKQPRTMNTESAGQADHIMAAYPATIRHGIYRDIVVEMAGVLARRARVGVPGAKTRDVTDLFDCYLMDLASIAVTSDYRMNAVKEPNYTARVYNAYKQMLHARMADTPALQALLPPDKGLFGVARDFTTLATSLAANNRGDSIQRPAPADEARPRLPGTGATTRTPPAAPPPPGRRDNRPRFVVRSGFDARRFTHDGDPVTDLTVRIALHGTPDQVNDVIGRLRDGVDEYLNTPGHRLPDGDRLHVTVERADPADAPHLTVDLVGRDRAMDQTTWWTDAAPIQFVHELTHQLGLRDEYRDADSPQRPHILGSLLGDLDAAPEDSSLAPAGLRDRHLALLGALVGDVTRSPGQEDGRTWEAARAAAEPVTRRSVWVDPVSLPRPADDTPGSEVPAHMPQEGTLVPFRSGNFEFTNLKHTNEKYRDKAIRIIELLDEHATIKSYIGDRPVRITLRLRTTEAPADVTDRGDDGVDINLASYYFEKYDTGYIMGMLAHEIGLHPLASRNGSIPEEEELFAGMPLTVPGLESLSTPRFMNTEGAGQADHVMAAFPHTIRHGIYRDIVVEMAEVLAQRARAGVEGAAAKDVTDLFDCYLMDLASIAVTNDHRGRAITDPSYTARSYNAYKAQLAGHLPADSPLRALLPADKGRFGVLGDFAQLATSVGANNRGDSIQVPIPTGEAMPRLPQAGGEPAESRPADDPAATAAPPVSRSFKLGGYEFTNLNQTDAYVDKAVRIIELLDEHSTISDYVNGRPVRITLRLRTTEAPADVTDRGDDGVDINLASYYFEKYDTGYIMGMLAHEIGLHPLASRNGRIAEEEDLLAGMPLAVPGLESLSEPRFMNTVGAGQADHVMAAFPSSIRHALYRDVIVEMARVLEHRARVGVPGAKASDVTDLFDTYLMDLASIAVTNDHRARAITDPGFTARSYNAYKAQLDAQLPQGSRLRALLPADKGRFGVLRGFAQLATSVGTNNRGDSIQRPAQAGEARPRLPQGTGGGPRTEEELEQPAVPPPHRGPDSRPRFVVRSGFDARRFTYDGDTVTDLTVRVALRGTREQGARVRERLDAGVARLLNGPGHRLPSGDRLHVTVEYVDPADSPHLTVDLAARDRVMDQTTWWADADPAQLVHELTHQLGLRDEYRDADSPQRPHIAGSLLGDLGADPEDASLARAGLRGRHLALLGALIGDVDPHTVDDGGDQVPWEEAREASPPVIRRSVWVDPVSLPRAADDTASGDVPAHMPQEGTLVPFTSGNYEFTNLKHTNEKYRDKAIRIIELLGEHPVLAAYVGDRPVRITLRVRTTETPADVTDRGEAGVDINLASYYFEKYDIGSIMGMLAHEIGLHPLASQDRNIPDEEAMFQHFPLSVPGLEDQNPPRTMSTEGAGQADHIMAAYPSSTRHRIYRDIVLLMADQMARAAQAGVEGAKGTDVTDLIDTYLMDLASIALTNDHRTNAAKEPRNTAKVYNAYKAQLLQHMAPDSPARALVPPDKGMFGVVRDFAQLAAAVAANNRGDSIQVPIPTGEAMPRLPQAGDPASEPVLQSLRLGRFEFTNLNQTETYVDKAVRIVELLDEHATIKSYIGDRTVRITLRLRTTEAPADVTDRGDDGVDINLASYYFEKYDTGYIMGMLAHEIGLHPFASRNRNIAEEEDLYAGMPLPVPGLESLSTPRFMNTEGAGQADHVMAAFPHTIRHGLYRDIVVEMAGVLAQRARVGVAGAKSKDVTDLFDCYLMDLASIAVTNDHRGRAITDPSYTARSYNAYKAQLAGHLPADSPLRSLLPADKGRFGVLGDFAQLATSVGANNRGDSIQRPAPVGEAAPRLPQSDAEVGQEVIGRGPLRGARDGRPRFVVRSGFDARRFTHDGEPVTDLTVRVALRGAEGESARVFGRLAAGVEEFLNGRDHRLPNGDRLHVTVEPVDPVDAPHLTVELVGRDRGMDQKTWWVDAEPVQLVHELTHQLGLRDEYRDADAPQRPHVAGSLLGDLGADPEDASLARAGLRGRHLALLGALIGDVDLHTGDAADQTTTWEEARSAAAPVIRRSVWVDPVSLPRPTGENATAGDTADAEESATAGDVPPRMLTPFRSGNFEFTNLKHTDETYRDRAVRIIDLLRKHDTVRRYIGNRPCRITLHVRTTEPPADVLDRGPDGVEINLASYYFEKYDIGHVMGMLAHEIGLHPLASQNTGLPDEEAMFENFPLPVPGLEDVNPPRTMSTEGAGQADHIMAAYQSSTRHRIYRDIILEMARVLAQDVRNGEENAKPQDVTDVFDCYLMDLASIAVTNDHRVNAAMEPGYTARVYNAYKKTLHDLLAGEAEVRALLPSDKSRFGVMNDFRRIGTYVSLNNRGASIQREDAT